MVIYFCGLKSDSRGNLYYKDCYHPNSNCKMDSSLFHLNQSSDETLDMLKQFLPEIENELRQQIEPDLLQQFASKAQAELEQIESQAEGQYNQALQTLQCEFEQLKSQKERDLSAQLTDLEAARSEKEHQRMAAAQESFLQDNLDSRIFSHPEIQEIADEMENELGEILVEQYDYARQKKLKQLRIRLESREQRERNQTDKAIHAQIFEKSGLEGLKEEIKHFKISIASLKSKYNLKINGIHKGVQELTRKCKQIEYQNADQIIEQLEREIAQLKEEGLNQEASEISQEQENSSQADNYGGGISQYPPFGLGNQQFSNYPENQYLHEDIDLDSSNSNQDSSERAQEQSDSEIPMPPSHKNMLDHLLSTHQQTLTPMQDQQIYLEVPKQPLLNFNVAQMLREEWKEDDFDRYLSTQHQKENTSGQGNESQATSNFSSLYQQHLARLNRNPRQKLRKLSEKAKQQLLISLSSQRQKRQQYSLNG